MGGLSEAIRKAVDEDRSFITKQAAERLRQRGIMAWQAVAGLEDGDVLVERPQDEPFPSIEVRQSLPDGTEFKAVWSLAVESRVAQLVTVHFFDG